MIPFFCGKSLVHFKETLLRCTLYLLVQCSPSLIVITIFWNLSLCPRSNLVCLLVAMLVLRFGCSSYHCTLNGFTWLAPLGFSLFWFDFINNKFTSVQIQLNSYLVMEGKPLKGCWMEKIWYLISKVLELLIGVTVYSVGREVLFCDPQEKGARTELYVIGLKTK